MAHSTAVTAVRRKREREPSGTASSSGRPRWLGCVATTQGQPATRRCRCCVRHASITTRAAMLAAACRSGPERAAARDHAPAQAARIVHRKDVGPTATHKRCTQGCTRHRSDAARCHSLARRWHRPAQRCGASCSPRSTVQFQRSFACEAEVEHTHFARRGDHDVARLEVRMNDLTTMRMGERRADAADDAERETRAPSSGHPAASGCPRATRLRAAP